MSEFVLFIFRNRKRSDVFFGHFFGHLFGHLFGHFFGHQFGHFFGRFLGRFSGRCFEGFRAVAVLQLVGAFERPLIFFGWSAQGHSLAGWLVAIGAILWLVGSGVPPFLSRLVPFSGQLALGLWKRFLSYGLKCLVMVRSTHQSWFMVCARKRAMLDILPKSLYLLDLL